MTLAAFSSKAATTPKPRNVTGPKPTLAPTMSFIVASARGKGYGAPGKSPFATTAASTSGPARPGRTMHGGAGPRRPTLRMPLPLNNPSNRQAAPLLSAILIVILIVILIGPRIKIKLKNLRPHLFHALARTPKGLESQTQSSRSFRSRPDQTQTFPGYGRGGLAKPR